MPYQSSSDWNCTCQSEQHKCWQHQSVTRSALHWASVAQRHAVALLGCSSIAIVRALACSSISVSIVYQWQNCVLGCVLLVPRLGISGCQAGKSRSKQQQQTAAAAAAAPAAPAAAVPAVASISQPTDCSTCGVLETAEHLLLHCARYDVPRFELDALLSTVHTTDADGATITSTVPLILGVLPVTCKPAAAKQILTATGKFLKHLLPRAL